MLERRRFCTSAFSPLLKARVEETAQGTRITGRFRSYLFTRILVWAWLVLCLAMAVIAAVPTLRQEGWLVLMGMVNGWLGLIYGVNWLMSLPDRRAIRTFLLDLFSDVMDVPGTC